MRELRLVWRGDFAWVEEGELVMRRMVRFMPLKGMGAMARFGYSLAFVPAAERNTLSYHRTWRGAELDVFEWYPRAFTRNMSLMNPMVARTSVGAAARPLAEAARSWFAEAPDLAAVEQLLRDRIAGNVGGEMFPEPGYVLAFFAAARGQMTEARRLLGNSLPEELREKALGRTGLRLG